jgi:hypothetical protein
MPPDSVAQLQVVINNDGAEYRPLSGATVNVASQAPIDSKYFRVNGGEDAAPTRDLCRDRSAFGRYLIEFMSTLGYQKHCKSLIISVGKPSAPSPAPSSTSAFWLQTSAVRAEGRHFPEGADEGAERGAGAPLRKSPQRFQVDSEPTSAFSSLRALMRSDFAQTAG